MDASLVVLVIQQYGLWGLFAIAFGWLGFLQVKHMQASQHSRAALTAQKQQIANDKQDNENQFQRIIATSFTPLLEQNRSLQEQLTQLAVAQATLAKDHEHLVEEHEATKTDLKNAYREAADFKELAASNEELATTMQTRLAESKQNTEALKRRVEELEQRMEQYESDLQAERNAKEKAEAEHAELLASVEKRIAEAVAPLNKRISELEETVAERDSQIAELTEKLNKSKKLEGEPSDE